MSLPWPVYAALQFAARANQYQNWQNECGSLVAHCYGFGGSGYATAAAQGQAVGVNPNHNSAPVGSLHFWTEQGSWSAGAGHIAIDAGNGQIWSNDLQVNGEVHLSPFTGPVNQWGLVYMGWHAPNAAGFAQSWGTNPYWSPGPAPKPTPPPVPPSRTPLDEDVRK